MDFRILGPLEVSAGDGPIELGGRRQRTVLAALLLNANRIVSTDRLIDIVWGEDPPPTARRSTQAYVSRLRKLLGPERIEPVEPGYRLNVDDGELDADRFEALVAIGRTAATVDAARALDAVIEALSLWRGDALADLRGERIVAARALSYDEARLSAIEDRFDLELALGRDEAAIARLEACVADHPYRERFWGQLMLSLYRTGRQADALKAFGRARTRLVEDLGIDPSPDLRTLEEQILSQDPGIARGSANGAGRIDEGSIRNPYKGLASFTEDDSSDFYGRDRLVGIVVDRINSGARLVAVLGPSGCGKSSLLSAGAIPALRARAERAGTALQVVQMEPGKHPFEALERAIVRQCGTARDGLLADLELDPDAAVEAMCGHTDGSTALVVDHFEDLFVAVDPVVSERFIDLLVYLVTRPERSVFVLLALRADFYDRPLRSAGLAELLVRGMVAVTPLNTEELRAAIVEPAARVGVVIDPDLVLRLLDDVHREPSALPQLQYVLTRLFEARSGRAITTAHYEDEGGMRGILARRAESAYLALGKADRAGARQVFLRLVRVREGGLATRRRAPLDEIMALSPIASTVLDRFSSYRLIGFDRDPVSKRPTVSLVHEALIADWVRLRSWITLDRVDLQLRELLDVEARTWQESDYDPDYLLAGSRLEQFEEWDERTSLALTDAERSYLTASCRRRTSEENIARERANRERSLESRAHNRAVALAIVMSLAAIIAAVLAIVAISLGRAAEQHAADAERIAAEADEDRLAAFASEAQALATSLTHGAVASLRTDPERSLLLAVHAAGVLRDSGQEVNARAVEALHIAIQAARIPYPGDAERARVIDGPFGKVGVYDLPLPDLVALAESGIERTLSDQECVAFFADLECPGELPAIEGGTATEAFPTEPVESAFPLWGTTVRVVSPWVGDEGVAFAADLARFTSRTGIAVVTTAPGFGPQDHGMPADIVGVIEPIGGAQDRYDDLVDVGTYLNRERLETDHYAYLLGLMALADGVESDSAPAQLKAIPLAVSVKSLVWYPATAFADAEYRVPTTWEELTALADQMVAEGRTPWCMAEAGTAPGGPATDFVEDLVLRGSGVQAYDRWVKGEIPFRAIPVQRAFRRYGELMLEPGQVYGGIEQAIELSSAEGMGLMRLAEPECWMHHQGSYVLRHLPPAGPQAGQIAYFVLPAPEPRYGGAILGSAVFAGAMSDRPEVREVMRFLAGPEYGVALTQAVGSGFVVANRSFLPAYEPSDARAGIASIAHAALAEGTFRIDASVAMGIESDFRDAMISYLKGGPDALPWIISRMDGGRVQAPDSSRDAL